MDEILTFFFFSLSIYVQAELILTKSIYVLFRVCSSQFPETTLAVRNLSDSYVHRNVSFEN